MSTKKRQRRRPVSSEKKSPPIPLLIASIIGGVVILSCCICSGIFSMFDETDTEKASREKKEVVEELNSNKIGAWVVAQTFVEKRLKSPSTASYGGVFSGDMQLPDDCVTSLGNDEYQVKGWVDSKNAFGATVRIHFSLNVKNNGDDSWSLIGEPVMIQR